jgi:hypothetical protein
VHERAPAIDSDSGRPALMPAGEGGDKMRKIVSDSLHNEQALR